MNYCKKCILTKSHPFGIYTNGRLCSGCSSFVIRKRRLSHWNKYHLKNLAEELERTIGYLPSKVVVPFDADGETWFVLDTLTSLGIKAVVVYFNAQYHDEIFFNILSACQENFDSDFIGFSLPKNIIQAALAEEFSVGSGHCRNLEIFGRHAATLFAAKQLGLKHIFSGPNQQSEVVGSHSFIVRNQLKAPSFNDIIIGKTLLPQVRAAIINTGSKFSQTFKLNVVESLLEEIEWHFLSDYIFWDSVSINEHFGNSFNVSPRIVNGFGPNWQSSSSSLKLEFFDLIRLLSTGTSKIDSLLSRDIRFGRLTKDDALKTRAAYLEKSWDIEGISHFQEVSAKSMKKAIALYQKKVASNYNPRSLAGPCTHNVTSHGQTLYY